MVGEVTERIPVTGPAMLPKDLIPRLISALVMAAIAIVCTWFGATPFALMVLAIALAMSWEWSRIVRGQSLDGALVAQGVCVALAIGLTAFGLPRHALATIAVGCLVAYLLGFLFARPQRPLFSALGVAYVGVPAVALVWLRDDVAYGALAILFIFAVVWTTDTFAYICGRMIGGPKLCPALSPGKTWAGTLGGLAFAAIVGGLFATIIVPQSAPLALAATAVVLSIVSQIGDLAESALKRAFSVKDASSLIPGHGGFMDRMDGIVTAASTAAIIAALHGPLSPAQALLLWS